jgi:hypothetical protein
VFRCCNTSPPVSTILTYSPCVVFALLAVQYDVAVHKAGQSEPDPKDRDIPSKKLRALLNKVTEQYADRLGTSHLAYDGRSILYAAPKLPFQEEQQDFEVEEEPARGNRAARCYALQITSTAERHLTDLTDYINGSRKEYPSDCLNSFILTVFNSSHAF